MNTLAYDVLHKITRKDKFIIDGRGEMDAMQIFLDMMTNPEFWKRQSIICKGKISPRHDWREYKNRLPERLLRFQSAVQIAEICRRSFSVKAGGSE
ncbi:MAG: hypothetical protein U0X76_05070 [Bacteroidia bacterium]